MGHYCRICGRSRPNEQFSGRGHRDHVCKACHAMPRGFKECITSPPWTARACDCGSGASFRDCCMDRENDLADEWAYDQWIVEREWELDDEHRGGYVQGFYESDASADASLWERALVGSRGGFEEFD